MFDKLQVAVWSLTYLTITIFSIIYRQERKPFFPLIPGAVTIAWELLALIHSSGFIGHIFWFSLDIVILLYNVWILGNWKRRGRYFLVICASVVILYFVFSFKAFNGMLISSFVDDFLIAIIYLTEIKHISSHGRLLIGVMRLIGDFFAWLAYMQTSVFILIIGVLVFLTNILYCSYCLELNSKKIKAITGIKKCKRTRNNVSSYK